MSAKSLVSSMLFLSLSACGVKGDPLPPERPAKLGRGRPTHRQATEKLKLPPTIEVEEEDKKKRTSR